MFAILSSRFCSPTSGAEGPGTDMATRVTPVGWTGPAVAPPSGCLTKHSGDSADVAAIIGGVRSMENGIAGFGSIHPKAVNQHRFYA